jgi:hypothetical protein
LAGAGLALILVSTLWAGHALAESAVTVGIPLLAAAAAYVLDEAASEAVAAVPITVRARTGSRIIVAVAIVMLGTLGLGAVAMRTTGVRMGMAVQLAGLALVAVAASAAMRRRFAEPGEAVGGGLLAVVLALTIAQPLGRWVDLFPTEEGQRWAASFVVWGAIAAASLLGLWVATRDPLD